MAMTLEGKMGLCMWKGKGYFVVGRFDEDPCCLFMNKSSRVPTMMHQALRQAMERQMEPRSRQYSEE